LALFLAAFVLATAGLPGWRRVGPAAGDEPKYLRIARSIHRDLDADVSGHQAGRLTLAGGLANVAALARATAAAVSSLVRGDAPPADHEWSRGNWTLNGWRGGHYHVHGPGFPALIAPVVGPPSDDGEPPTVPRAVLAVMALVWALAFVQTTLLAGDACGSRAVGAVTAAALLLSPAVFVGGYHVYADPLVVAAAPWLARRVWTGGTSPRSRSALAAGFVAGALVWLHVKFLPLGLVAVALLAWRFGRTRFAAAVVTAAALPLAAWVLFQYHVTGLVRPDASYVRYASEVWKGDPAGLTWRFVGGLSNGLFGARDGLFVMVPPALLALAGLPELWKHHRQQAIALALLFCGIWLAAALHGGGAAGPPGRLLSPAAPLLAVPMAFAVRRLLGVLAFRWSLGAGVLVSIAVIAAMAREPRLTVNPYRGIEASADIRRDLPIGRSNPAGALADAARASILLAGGALWCLGLTRAGGRSSTAGPPARTRILRDAAAFQAAAWLGVSACAATLGTLTWVAGG
jgi:hypothetical protein